MKVKGFTLIELLLTLIVAGIMIATAAPDFSEFVDENKLTTEYNHILTAISLTRSEAIKRNQRVTLCQSSTQATCTRNSDKWHQGWAIFVDSDQDNQIDSDELIITIQSNIPNINISFGARTRIAYRPSGVAVGGSNGTIILCANNQLKGIVISRAGRARKVRQNDLKAKTCIT